MPVWVSKEAPGPTGVPEIELHVVFPGEANSAQSLNSGVADLPVTIAYSLVVAQWLTLGVRQTEHSLSYDIALHFTGARFNGIASRTQVFILSATLEGGVH